MNRTLLAVSVAFVFMAPNAFAQTPSWTTPWTDRGFVNVDVGWQTNSHDVTDGFTFSIYDEPATVTTEREVKGGVLFDVRGGVKVWSNLAVGLGYTHFGDDTPTVVLGQIPHPILFDRPRSLVGEADLKHSENVIHIQATYFFPITELFDVSVFAGPSFFSVSQEFVTAITVQETAPFSTVSLASVTVTPEDDTAVGINLGADATYRFTKNVGVGGFLRYAGAKATFDNDAELDVGGFQLGVGLRLRF